MTMEGPKRLNQHLPEVVHSGPCFSAQYPYEDYEDYRRPSNPPTQENQRQPTTPPHFIKSLNLTPEHATALAIGDGLEPCFAPTERPGQQSVNEREGEKEVHHKADPATGVVLDMPHNQQPEERRRKRICGINITWFLLLVALIACAVIAIAAACGVIFGTKKM
jgi:hypothetical protein